MTENRKKEMIFSYIFPKIRVFSLKYWTVEQPLKIWKRVISEIDLLKFFNII